ncbi:MAG: aldehyde dehydrogenase [Lachnospiraceae bacterium]|jgi:aldehyde dehydrogenase (NAD+)
MEANEIKEIIRNQKIYFQSGITLNVKHRMAALEALKNSILRHEKEINDALKKDLGKSASESYMSEIGMVLSEIRYMLKHIRLFSREKTVRTPLAQFHSRSYRKPSPYGVVLIMSPWNYPFLLTLDPLVDAIAAGNTAVLKPSAYAPHTGEILQAIVSECFCEEYVAVITGGRTENTCLLQESFDYIFFTGNPTVGREVMRCAAEHLTPVTLELGGKSPCIVEKTADLKLAAKRIVFGKFLNCGQTCVAPDYVYCDAAIRDRLVEELKKQITHQFGSHPLDNPDYGKIINEKHFRRLCGLMDHSKMIFGGRTNENELRIEPTLFCPVTFDDAIMQEEIFGPLLPILTYDSLEQAIAVINSRPHPLALYLFTKNKALAKKVTARCGFGGGCINDTIIHLATSEMGFGGFGESGMGSYHGKEGFRTFSHDKSIVDKKTWLDLPMRYQPYQSWQQKLIRLFLR